MKVLSKPHALSKRPSASAVAGATLRVPRRRERKRTNAAARRSCAPVLVLPRLSPPRRRQLDGHAAQPGARLHLGRAGVGAVGRAAQPEHKVEGLGSPLRLSVAFQQRQILAQQHKGALVGRLLLRRIR